MMESSAWPTARRICSCASTCKAKSPCFEPNTRRSQLSWDEPVNQSIHSILRRCPSLSDCVVLSRRSSCWINPRILQLLVISFAQRFKLSRQVGTGLQGYEASVRPLARRSGQAVSSLPGARRLLGERSSGEDHLKAPYARSIQGRRRCWAYGCGSNRLRRKSGRRSRSGDG